MTTTTRTEVQTDATEGRKPLTRAQARLLEEVRGSEEPLALRDARRFAAARSLARRGLVKATVVAIPYVASRGGVYGKKRLSITYVLTPTTENAMTTPTTPTVPTKLEVLIQDALEAGFTVSRDASGVRIVKTRGRRITRGVRIWPNGVATRLDVELHLAVGISKVSSIRKVLGL